MEKEEDFRQIFKDYAHEMIDDEVIELVIFFGDMIKAKKLDNARKYGRHLLKYKRDY